MQLTQQTDYALRMLIQLALKQSDVWTPVSELADTLKLSHSHLLKVARRLGEEGFLETRRGRGGGVRLARSPERIPVGEVVRTIEPGFALAACMQVPAGPCTLAPICALRGGLARACEAFLVELDGMTLADCIVSPTARR